MHLCNRNNIRVKKGKARHGKGGQKGQSGQYIAVPFDSIRFLYRTPTEKVPFTNCTYTMLCMVNGHFAYGISALNMLCMHMTVLFNILHTITTICTGSVKTQETIIKLNTVKIWILTKFSFWPFVAKRKMKVARKDFGNFFSEGLRETKTPFQYFQASQMISLFLLLYFFFVRKKWPLWACWKKDWTAVYYIYHFV